MRALILTVLIASSLEGQSSTPSRAGKRVLLPRATEIALARSAAPPSVSAGARVLIMVDTGFVIGEPGTNGVTCVLNRSWPESLEPHCYDAEGAATILPMELRRTVMRHQGRSESEIDREIADGLASGKYRLPARPALSYMMSEGQRLVDETGKPVGKWRPHVMLYYPYLTSAALGLGAQPDMRVGAVSEEGRPDATLMIVVPQFIPVVPPERE